MASSDVEALLRTLTPTELTVLRLRCEGMEWPEVAERLVVAERTVYFHVANIYDKLNIASLPSRRKRDIALRQIFCPVLANMPPSPVSPSSGDAEPPEPDEDILALVLYDALAPEVIDRDSPLAGRPRSSRQEEQEEKIIHVRIPEGGRQQLTGLSKPSASQRIGNALWGGLGVVVGLLVALAAVSRFAPASPPPQATPAAAAAQLVQVVVTATAGPLVAAAPAATAAPPPTIVPTMVPTAVPTMVPTAVPTPMPTATQPPKPGTVLYQADWSQGSAGWLGSRDWKTVNSMLVSDGSNGYPNEFYFAISAGAVPSIWVPYLPKTSDYAVEVEMQALLMDNDVIDTSFGIVVRQGYVASVRRGDIGVWDVDMRPFTPDTRWHTYRIEAKANTIRFLVDSAPIVDQTDNRYLDPGRIGLWSFETQLNIRSLKIIAL